MAFLQPRLIISAAPHSCLPVSLAGPLAYLKAMINDNDFGVDGCCQSIRLPATRYLASLIVSLLTSPLLTPVLARLHPC
ncbi:uncharacterized protein BJ212DRAFT_1354293 [Suillus subaureus]|uniref:Uncharacterized protein n=1 Tax=Suillus subaureus TaxID=48587 RepID=A0A9P7JDH8_9AGAM|nr:uncharacterized protein BJ212DRAFT_1354293 [Suillus subaureus]KAG1816340.1 hypothetical protein BJ212DRAFT_1354293 [Suillus subaureus]